MSRVCVFGDSITWGSWDPEGGGWVGRLQREGCERGSDYRDYIAVYNCGVSGDKLADLLARFDAEAASRQPNAVVIAIGINDAPQDNYPGTPLADFRADYQRLVQSAIGLVERNVVLLSPNNVDEARAEHHSRNVDIRVIRDIVATSATEFNLSFVDLFDLLTPTDLDPDGLHPGAAGHQKIYQASKSAIFGLPALTQS